MVVSVLSRALLAPISVACAAFLLADPASAQSSCDADINHDGVVGAADLTSLLSAWGPCPGCAADINRSGAVDAYDITALLALWNAPCLAWGTVLEQMPDPAVVTNANLRNAIIATGLPWRVRDNATQIEMVLIPPGTFDMGCSASLIYACYASESPIHSVTLTSAFYLGRYEVTQAQWTARVGSNPSAFQGANYPDAAIRPVEQVSWNSVQGFLAGSGLRLPTEAEWEYAYRAGTQTAFHSMPGLPNGTSDDAFVGTISWNPLDSSSQTHAVGQKAANGYGLHDMSGNVWECVSDWYGANYYASSPSVNPTGPLSGTFRVVRGGSWGTLGENLRSSIRGNTITPNSVSSRGGFRVARNP